MKVFLSHSSVDKDLARRLARDLRSANIDVWLDQWEIRVGQEFVQTIEKGVDNSDFMIVLLTHASVGTEWVNREWRRKVQSESQTRRLAVLPVRGEPCEIPDFLAQRSHADISGGSYPLGLRHLLTMLRHYSEDLSIKVPEQAFDPDSDETMIPVVSPIALEISADLIPIFSSDGEEISPFFQKAAQKLREELQAELGVPFPGIRVRGNDTDIPPRSALILIDEIPELMLALSGDEARTTSGPEKIFTHLKNLLRQNASQFIDIDVTHRLVQSFASEAPALVTAAVPKIISWFELTDILQRLVDEQVSISDIGRILEAISQRPPELQELRDTVLLTERVRHALRGQITARFTRGASVLSVLELDPEIENRVHGLLQRTPAGPYLSADSQLTQEILTAARVQICKLPSGAPILVSNVELRPFIRKMVSVEFPSLHVLSRQDLEPHVQIQVLGRIAPAQKPDSA